MEVLGFFAATEDWFRKNAPDPLNQYFHLGEGDFEKWKSKILKTELRPEKIKKISDLPLLEELSEEAEKEDLRSWFSVERDSIFAGAEQNINSSGVAQ